MSEEVLYHFFPRTAEKSDTIYKTLSSILSDGLLLTEEIINIDWDDKFGKRTGHKLSIIQYRFCLTAISNKEELQRHSDNFGEIGVEFNTNAIIRMGGFPVFYVPTPPNNSAPTEEHIGVSLLYRLGEAQEIMDYIVRKSKFKSDSIDAKNVLGALKFIGNICYPIKKQSNNGSRLYNYYNQREWRIIHGLTSVNTVVTPTSFNGKKAFMLKEFEKKPICNYINKIVLSDNCRVSKEEIVKLMKTLNLPIAIRSINEI